MGHAPTAYRLPPPDVEQDRGTVPGEGHGVGQPPAIGSGVLVAGQKAVRAIKRKVLPAVGRVDDHETMAEVAAEHKGLHADQLQAPELDAPPDATQANDNAAGTGDRQDVALQRPQSYQRKGYRDFAQPQRPA